MTCAHSVPRCCCIQRRHFQVGRVCGDDHV
jgi:hypothetical protein